MARIFSGGKLVVASHNPGKVHELNELLAPYGAELIGAGALGLPEPDETGATFIATAELKALAAARAANLPAIADDSGVVVNALGGAPGIFSARWAGPSKDFNIAMKLVWDRVQAEGGTDLVAHFVSALSLAWPDGHVDSFEGYVHGTLVWPPRGTRGFGYDPMFLPDGGGETFGEMAPDSKHAISHRADAFRKLIHACFRA